MFTGVSRSTGYHGGRVGRILSSGRYASVQEAIEPHLTLNPIAHEVMTSELGKEASFECGRAAIMHNNYVDRHSRASEHSWRKQESQSRREHRLPDRVTRP